jgi:hypothetical protein
MVCGVTKSFPGARSLLLREVVVVGSTLSGTVCTINEHQSQLCKQNKKNSMEQNLSGVANSRSASQEFPSHLCSPKLPCSQEPAYTSYSQPLTLLSLVFSIISNAVFCIYEFCVVLTVNSNNFLKHH